MAENDPDSVEAFEKGATAYVKKVLGSFKDWEFYTGESMDPDAMVVLLNYREDGTTPYVAIWKHGVKKQNLRVLNTCTIRLYGIYIQSILFVISKYNSLLVSNCVLQSVVSGENLLCMESIEWY